MLLIAEPKSASTSLLYSIAEIGKLQRKNGQNRQAKDVKCNEYENIQTYHGTTVKRNYAYLEKYLKSRILIYKEHILPTKEHLDILKKIDTNFVVLLRDTESIMKSYSRVFDVLPELNIDRKRMKAEIQEFSDRYMELNWNTILIVTYNDIVNSFTEIMEKILVHYELEIPADINKYKLAKRNYRWSS